MTRTGIHGSIVGLAAALALTVMTSALALTVMTSAAVAAPAGQVYGSGYNEYGALGSSEGEYIYAFLPLEGLSNAVQASSGYYASAVLLADGTVQTSGYNGYGELGDGSTTERAGFAPVPGLANVTAVAAGAYSDYALLSNGTVEAWGYNYYGELGDGEFATSGCDCATSPVQVKGVGGEGVLSNVVAISAGDESAAALLSNGTVVAWGVGGGGQLGNGEEANSDVPVQVSGLGGTGNLSNVTAISAGGGFTMALLSNGTVAAWGEGKYGRLGNGEEVNSEFPVEVKGLAGKGTLSGVSAISAGGWFGTALLSNGTVAAWGYGYYGELGNGQSGASAASDVPVQVNGVKGEGVLSEVSAISAGGYYTLALTQSGALYGWGYADYGELGDGRYEEAYTPRRNEIAPKGIFSLGHGGGDDGYTSLIITGALAKLSTSSLAFSSETVGASSPAQSVTLANEGPAPLSVSGETVSGSGAAAFTKTADGCSGTTLQAGASCTVSIVFKPAAAGAASATLTFASTAANTLPAVTLSGTGTSPLPPPTTTTPSGKAHGELQVAHKAKVKGATALVKVTCAGKGACKGSLQLIAKIRAGKGHGKRHHVKQVVIGTASFSIAKHGSAVVKVHLSKQARALLRQARKHKLVVTVTGSGVSGGKLALVSPQRAARHKLRRVHRKG